MTKSILMVGVGGQGIILASNIACEALMAAGYDVKKSEIHGMAQRGGSVVSHVKYGKSVSSPVISEGEADVIMSFEYMEFLRYMSYKNDNTTLILNTRRILPPSVANGTNAYPADVVERDKLLYKNLCEVDADGLAEKAGNVKAASMPLLGELAKILDVDMSIWEKVIKENVPQKTIDVNIKAFNSVY